MSRFNWMSFAMYTVPIVCLVLALSIGWYTFGQLTKTRADHEEVEKQIALEREKQKQKQKQWEDAQKNHPLTAPSQGEEAVFFQTIPAMMQACGITQSHMEPRDLQALPSYNAKKSDPSSSSSSADKKTDKKTDYSLTNLPLATRARSTQFSARGSYANIRRFLQQLSAYRATRAININTLHISNSNPNEKELTLDITLTRFIRDEEKPASNKVGSPSGATGSPSGTLDKTGASDKPGATDKVGASEKTGVAPSTEVKQSPTTASSPSGGTAR